MNDRLDRYGRLLVTRDLVRWAADLEMNQRRIELIRKRDSKAYARMIRSRHAGGTLDHRAAGRGAGGRARGRLSCRWGLHGNRLGRPSTGPGHTASHRRQMGTDSGAWARGQPICHPERREAERRISSR